MDRTDVTRGPAAMQRWDLDLSGSLHVVEIACDSDGPPLRFVLDGASQQFPDAVLGRPRIATFMVAGHPASLTMSKVGLPTWLPSVGESTRVKDYVVYTLDVGGIGRGSWVATLLRGVIAGWTFVPPGGELPDPYTTWGPGEPPDPSRLDMLDHPIAAAPRPRTSRQLLPVASPTSTSWDWALLLLGLAALAVFAGLVVLLADLSVAHPGG